MQVRLVERAIGGDREAFASLAADHVDRCYALAYRILRDPHRAEDATQQALLGAWRDLPTLRDPERFDAWLHRLVVNACYQEARGTRRWTARVRVIGAEPSPLEPDVARSVAARDELVGRGVDVSEPFHFGPEGQTPGVSPGRGRYETFATFEDPDGNGWMLQEVPADAGEG